MDILHVNGLISNVNKYSLGLDLKTGMTCIMVILYLQAHCLFLSDILSVGPVTMIVLYYVITVAVIFSHVIHNRKIFSFKSMKMFNRTI